MRADWRVPDGSTLLREETRFAFSGGPARRVVDRITTWTAADTPVTFADTKEGAFGIRVARALDSPSTDGPPGPGPEPTGLYIGSDGKTGDAVWGTRGPWMGLTGFLEDGPVTMATSIIPPITGHPTYWHARGYGLFAANPLGRQGYDPAQLPTTLTLARPARPSPSGIASSFSMSSFGATSSSRSSIDTSLKENADRRPCLAAMVSGVGVTVRSQYRLPADRALRLAEVTGPP